MKAFRQLEQRLMKMTFNEVNDAPEAVVVVGLFTSEPPETHNGDYGQNGEPQRALVGVPGGYKRVSVQFVIEQDALGATEAKNASTVSITGLEPGTYTHFALFGDKVG